MTSVWVVEHDPGFYEGPTLIGICADEVTGQNLAMTYAAEETAFNLFLAARRGHMNPTDERVRQIFESSLTFYDVTEHPLLEEVPGKD